MYRFCALLSSPLPLPRAMDATAVLLRARREILWILSLSLSSSYHDRSEGIDRPRFDASPVDLRDANVCVCSVVPAERSPPSSSVVFRVVFRVVFFFFFALETHAGLFRKARRSFLPLG